MHSRHRFFFKSLFSDSGHFRFFILRALAHKRWKQFTEGSLIEVAALNPTGNKLQNYYHSSDFYLTQKSTAIYMSVVTFMHGKQCEFLIFCSFNYRYKINLIFQSLTVQTEITVDQGNIDLSWSWSINCCISGLGVMLRVKWDSYAQQTKQHECSIIFSLLF